MKLVKNYIAYLKDNPEGYWFKRKLFGWGWTPATREGWLVILVFIAAVLVIVVRGELLESEEAILKQVIVPVFGLVFLLIYISWKTGEPPKWQWHFPKDIGDDVDNKDK